MGDDEHSSELTEAIQWILFHFSFEKAHFHIAQTFRYKHFVYELNFTVLPANKWRKKTQEKNTKWNKRTQNEKWKYKNRNGVHIKM